MADSPVGGTSDQYEIGEVSLVNKVSVEFGVVIRKCCGSWVLIMTEFKGCIRSSSIAIQRIRRFFRAPIRH